MKLKIKRLTDTAKLPEKNNPTDAGFDIFSDEKVFLEEGETHLVSTGIAIEIPDGYYGRLKGRSGLTSKTPLRIQEGTIDSGYRGEVKVMCEIYPLSKSIKSYDVPPRDYWIQKGDNIAQLIIQPLPEFTIEEVDSLNDTARGEKGFGSSGI